MSAVYRTARKKHQCSCCGGPIEVGHRYRDCRDPRQRGVATRECLPCGKRIEGEEEDDRIHREALESIPDDAWML